MMKNLLFIILLAIMAVSCAGQQVCEESKKEPVKKKTWSGYVRTV